MKFTVLMKHPDVLDEAIADAVDNNRPDGLTDGEWEDIKDSRRESVLELCKKWFEYEEVVRLEIDTESETCTVIDL
jgi:hypothetical protein